MEDEAEVDPETGLNLKAHINLAEAVVLIVDDNPQALEILSSVFHGFGVRQKIKCATSESAVEIVRRQEVDLVVIECSRPEMDGHDFVRWLRHSEVKSRYAPVIMLTGHAALSKVAKSRDSGANFVVAKPITPHVLLQRIMWVAAERRPFVETDGGYIGPDRRFKHEGPPVGSDGRRRNDLSAEVGAATAPNMSQDQIDQMFKPNKVAL